MSEGDQFRTTEYWDAHGRQPPPGNVPYQGGWPGLGGPQHEHGTRTEVLNTPGPRIFGMLVIVDGPGTGHIFKLNPGEPNSLGRDYNSDIVIDEPAVSRQHAKIRLERLDSGELRYFIQDMATENGIEVNGENIVRHNLADGDRIKLGRVLLVYKQV